MNLKQSLQYKQTIENLKTETKKLREQLCLDNLQQSNLGVETEIARLQEQGDNFARKIEIEKKKIADLDQKIAMMTEKLKAQREAIGGAQGAKETNEGIARKIKSLENKLDKSLQKYNEAIAHNKQLREQIDKLRRERVVYDSIYKKLEEELQSKKEEMKRIVKKGYKAKKKRDEAKRKMEELKKEAEKEQEEFEKHWQDLGKLIEQDKKIKEFISQEESVEVPEPPENAELAALNKKVAKSAWNIAKEKASVKMYLEKVEMYEEAFRKIEEATGISDIDELVKTFVEAEMQNYSLFNTVNDLAGDMEKLEQQINEIKAEIEKYKNHGFSADNQRKKQMKELEQKLEKTEKKAYEYETRYANNQEMLDSLKAGIQELFERLGCTLNPHSDVLGNPGITDSNILQYMGQIEEKTNSVIHQYNSLNPMNSQTLSMTTSAPPPLLPTSNRIALDLPSVPDKDKADDEETSLPMTVKEMKAISMKKLEEGCDKRKKFK
ncbi:hypothetical protein SteCoe_18615 [Stentor coeruleus]|uniref:ODAD1 central coiled coil region domain-containing protein n=1 Tax=Stentor coeruleus TaxID=5963 RepID=A0A1R2BW04_9CILI|nr:hypothetical protein SteCoe_18615 [Stentor coeruleus]